VIQQNVGRYQIVRKLGDGGMGAVYLAHDPRFPRDVALKILHPQFSQDPSFRERFDREARTIAALEHHAIVPVHDFGEHESRPYLVMRLMTGGTLVNWRRDGHLSVGEISPIVGRIASALDRAHELEIVHRDLKPANVLFDDRGNAYLSDFGIVKLLSAHTLTADQALIGTPTYMSPEQAQGDKQLDGRSDIYSLGVVIFELLNGTAPYPADTGIAVALKHITAPVPSLREARPDLAPGVCHVVEQALAKDPKQRFPTAGAFAQALSAAAAGSHFAQAPTVCRALANGEASFPQTPSPWRRGRRRPDRRGSATWGSAGAYEPFWLWDPGSGDADGHGYTGCGHGDRRDRCWLRGRNSGCRPRRARRGTDSDLDSGPYGNWDGNSVAYARVQCRRYDGRGERRQGDGLRAGRRLLAR